MIPPALRIPSTSIFATGLHRNLAARGRRLPSASSPDRSGPAGRPRAANRRRSAKISSATTARAPTALCHCGSVSALSSATTKPSRASAIAGLSRSASVNLPEPYFSSASASPATVPGTPMPSAESRDFAGSGLPSAPRNIRALSRPARSRDNRWRCPRLRVGEMDHHEAAAADISGAGIGDRHGKAGRHRRIDGIAAARQNVRADSGRDLLLRHHHAVFRKRMAGRAGSERCRELRRASCADAGNAKQQCRDRKELCRRGLRRIMH